MSYHVEFLPVYVFLTGMMEVELCELVYFVADGESASRLVIDHDRVAIIDNAYRNSVVIEVQGRQIRFFGVSNVNWRLAVSVCAGGIGRIQFAPMLRIFGASVRPVRRMGFLCERCGRHNQETHSKNDHQTIAIMRLRHRRLLRYEAICW